jgi:hypothetical protein
MGFILFLAHAAAALLVKHQHAGRDTLLVHVQATATGVNCLHRSLLLAAGRKTLKEKSDIPSRAFSCSPAWRRRHTSLFQQCVQPDSRTGSKHQTEVGLIRRRPLYRAPNRWRFHPYLVPAFAPAWVSHESSPPRFSSLPSTSPQFAAYSRQVLQMQVAGLGSFCNFDKGGERMRPSRRRSRITKRTQARSFR